MASGDTLIFFTPADAVPPAANAATPDTRAGATNAINEVLDFDDTTAESADFSGFVPRHASASPNITLLLMWMATSATTGNVKWNALVKSVTDDADDLDTKDFAAAQTATDATASLSGEVAYTEIALTNAQADSIAKGEYFKLRVTRDAADAGDTMTGDAELVGVEIRET